MLGHSRISPTGIYLTPSEEDLRLALGRAGLEARGELSTVGILGQIVTFVGAGEVRSGVGTLASPMGTGRRATQGSPPFIPATPAPTRRIRFPTRFTKYLPLRDFLASLLTSQQPGVRCAASRRVGLTLAVNLASLQGWISNRRGAQMYLGKHLAQPIP